MSGNDRERTYWFMCNILPHEPALRGWLSRRPIAGIDPEDVIQESYTILAELECVDMICHPRAYLFQVARSVISRHVRRARIIPIHIAEDIGQFDIEDDAATPEQLAIDRDELNHLAAAIAAMPPKTREAFVLRRVEGLPQRAIAVQMNISENTVETHISRGIRFLVEWYGGSGKSQPKASEYVEREIAVTDGPTRQQSRH